MEPIEFSPVADPPGRGILDPVECLLEPGRDIRALFKLLGGAEMVAHVRRQKTLDFGRDILAAKRAR